MKPDQRCQLLAEKIDGILRRGLTLDSKTLHFIDSTWLNPDTDQLKHFLCDESDSERESVLDLIFSPDESVQIELEDLLESKNFSRQDENVVRDLLMSRLPQTRLHFPDGRGALRLVLPAFNAGRFISRLRISKKLEDRIIESVNAHVNEEARASVKVRFRNKRTVCTENKIRFLCMFFERMNTNMTGFTDCVGFILSLLDEIREDNDMYHALISKKQSIFRSVQQAGKFEEQLKKSNIEIMRSQGFSAPYINKEEAIGNMRWIDRINMSVFGKTEFYEEPGPSVDYGEIENVHDVENITMMLS